MSLTTIISSWLSSNVVVRTSAGSRQSPENVSAYARATRAGVSTSPSRSGSSPIASRISRTAASTRGPSYGGRGGVPPPLPGKRSALLGRVDLAALGHLDGLLGGVLVSGLGGLVLRRQDLAVGPAVAGGLPLGRRQDRRDVGDVPLVAGEPDGSQVSLD